MARTKLLVDIEANSAKLVTEMEKSRKAVHGLKGELQLIKFDSIVNLGERAFRAGQQIFGLAKEMTALGSDIQRNARAMGMTISAYQEWSYVAKSADVETEQFMMGIRNLTNVMQDSPKKVEALGVSVKAASGGFRTIDDILPEIVSRMSSMTDVTKQNAVAMDLFGSGSGMAFANLVREGKNIDEIRRRFREMGLEIEEGTIKKLAESEQAFKDLVFAGMKLKASLLPVIQEIAKATEWWASAIGNVTKRFEIMAEHNEVKELKNLKEWLKYAKEQGGSPDLIAEYEKRIKTIQDRWRGNAPAAIAGKPGGGTVAGEEPKPVIKSFDYIWSAYADQAKKYSEIVDKVVADHMANIKGDFIDFQTAAVQGWEYIGVEGEVSLKKIGELMEQSAESWTKVMGAVHGGEANMYDFGNLIPLKAYEEGLKTSAKATTDFGTIFENTFSSMSSSLTTLVNSSASFGERMKAIFSDMANSIIESLTKAAFNMAIFGNMKGSLSGGKGWGTSGQGGYGGLVGLIGGVIGSLDTGTDYVPKTGLYQLHKGESVIPPGQHEGGGNTYIINNISANDAKSFDDMVRRNPESILSISQRSARAGGTFRTILRG